MNQSDTLVQIKQLHGPSWPSPFSGKRIVTKGLITGVVRRGFFLQTPNVDWDNKTSDAVFVYSPEWSAERGEIVEVAGKVVDYKKHDTAKPVTQLHLKQGRLLSKKDALGEDLKVVAIDFSNALLPSNTSQLAIKLNSMSAMLVNINAGQTFIAPSNKFGDYVLALDAEEQDQDNSLIRTVNNGVVADPDNPLRWFAGFRMTNYNHALRLNVGSRLLSCVVGPLNYRADSYQISLTDPFKIDPAFISLPKTSLEPDDQGVTIMTLNCFNLDPHVEAESKVMNPRQDVDDDWGEGRFHTLAQAVVLQANLPDIVALQEIQDNDGAELSDVVDANVTLELLIDVIEQLSSIRYQWTSINPVLGGDGGQPGGNIRNAYLFNPNRVKLVKGSVSVLGKNQPCFVDSRKPLIAHFEECQTGKVIVCINIHLASKRHQQSIFAPTEPGVDGKLSVRVAQAQRIAKEIHSIRAQNLDYYVTGDFNDTETSQTLLAITADDSYNLVESLDESERYDYNHRGKLQALMHGVVSKEMAAKAQYEIIHGNELIGVKPGEVSDKPSDHAYVIAKLPI